MDMAEIFNNKYFKGEGYISADVSGVVWSKKINNTTDGKYIKEQLEKINPNHKNEVNLETIKFISNYIIENNDKFDKMIEFNRACERLQKLRAEGYYD